MIIIFDNIILNIAFFLFIVIYNTVTTTTFFIFIHYISILVIL